MHPSYFPQVLREAEGPDLHLRSHQPSSAMQPQPQQAGGANRPQFCRQLFTLLRKNAILKTRTPGEWSCECLIPILFVAIIALVFSLFDKQVRAPALALLRCFSGAPPPGAPPSSLSPTRARLPARRPPPTPPTRWPRSPCCPFPADWGPTP